MRFCDFRGVWKKLSNQFISMNKLKLIFHVALNFGSCIFFHHYLSNITPPPICYERLKAINTLFSQNFNIPINELIFILTLCLIRDNLNSFIMFFIRSSKDGMYYGMALSVRPSVRPQLLVNAISWTLLVRLTSCFDMALILLRPRTLLSLGILWNPRWPP